MTESEQAILMRDGLKFAMQFHDEAYPDGNWQLANELIGIFVIMADCMIMNGNRWPKEKRYLWNAKRIEILTEMIGEMGT